MINSITIKDIAFRCLKYAGELKYLYSVDDLIAYACYKHNWKLSDSEKFQLRQQIRKGMKGFE